jgi:hypothetical protein
VARLRREVLALERAAKARTSSRVILADGRRPEVVDDVDPQLRLRLAFRSTLDRHLFADLPSAAPASARVRHVGMLLRVDEADPSLDLPATVAPFRDPGVAVGPGALDERSAAVPAPRWVRATAG